MSYALYRSLHAPSVVDHCLSATLSNENDRNLVVGRGSLLEIYRVHPTTQLPQPDQQTQQQQTTGRSGGSSSSSSSSSKPSSSVLELIGSWPLFGAIESLGVVRFSKQKVDSLLVSFKDGKVTICQFDQARHDLRIVSMHCFEKEDLKEGRIIFSSFPALRIDPQHRCAVLLLYDRHLAVMAFRRREDSVLQDEDVFDEEDDFYRMNTNSSSSSSSSTPTSNNRPGEGEQVLGRDVLPSYVVPLKEIGGGVGGARNVKDYVFLHGYYEPTLLLLDEPQLTWPGRYPIAQSTCRLTAISLNVSQRLHPVIWSIDDLPHDSYALASVPEPLGGALVFSANAISYYNQGARFVLPLNPFSPQFRPKPNKEQQETYITGDNAKFAFLSPSVLLASLQHGDLYLIKLISDGITVREIQLTKAGTSVITSCICVVGEEYLFLGSRVSDSLVIRYEEKQEEKTVESTTTSQNGNGHKDDNYDDDDDDEESLYSHTPKKRRLETSLEEQQEGGDEAAGDLEDELYMYQSEVNTKRQEQGGDKTNYAFAIKDSLRNIGPIRDIAIGESADYATVTNTLQRVKKSLEIVTASGYHKNGCLCVLQRGVRPQFINMDSVVDLPGVNAVWTLFSPTKQRNEDDEEVEAQEGFHSYMVLSKDDGTMVLATGEELEEISDKVEFYLDGPTVAVGTLFLHRKIVQVYAAGVRVLDGLALEQEILVTDLLPERMDLDESMKDEEEEEEKEERKKDDEVVIVNGIFCDPYVGLLLSDGSLWVFHSKEERKGPSSSKIEITRYLLQQSKNPKSGEDDKDAVTSCFIFVESATAFGGDMPYENESHFCAVTRRSGSLDIYKLPELTMVFHCPSFSKGPRLAYSSAHNLTRYAASLSSSSSSTSTSTPLSSSAAGVNNNSDLCVDPMVVEMRFTQLGKYNTNFLSSKSLFLFALTDLGDFYAYRGFFYRNQLRFVRHRIEASVRDFQTPPIIPTAGSGPLGLPNSSMIPITAAPSPAPLLLSSSTMTHRSFVEFMKKSKRNRMCMMDSMEWGHVLFICGKRPQWVFSDRNDLRVHPMTIDGTIACFAPFHNVNCSQGFIYFTHAGVLKIGQLASNMNYHTPWPMRKINLREGEQGNQKHITPLSITYHPSAQVYILLVSYPIPAVKTEKDTAVKEEENNSLREDGRDSRDKEKEESTNHPNALPLFEDKFEVRIVSPTTWEILDNFELDQYENATSVKVVNLKSDDSPSGRKLFIVVGTSYCNGEDTACKGRVLIFDYFHAVPFPGKDQSQINNTKLKLLFQKELKGPISSITDLQGYLVLAIGPKIIVYTFDGKDLIGASFFDAQIYVVSMQSIKNYVLVGDAYKSMYFLRWKEEGRSLTVVSKDYTHMNVLSTEFLIHQTSVSFVVSDDNQNLQLQYFAPQNIESRGGQMLLVGAEFHTGGLINKFLRIKLPPALTKNDNQHALLFGTTDGSLGYILPVEETIYRRLSNLYRKMVVAIPHDLGLNPLSFRVYHAKRKALKKPPRTFVDGDLVWSYLSLEVPQQRELARLIGTTPTNIWNNLIELDNDFSFF